MRARYGTPRWSGRVERLLLTDSYRLSLRLSLFPSRRCQAGSGGRLDVQGFAWIRRQFLHSRKPVCKEISEIERHHNAAISRISCPETIAELVEAAVGFDNLAITAGRKIGKLD